MGRESRFRLSPALVVSFVALFVALGGAAAAVIPDSSGVVHGCYQKNGGMLRVIDSDTGATCRASEVALNWSQTGAVGGFVSAPCCSPAPLGFPGTNVMELSQGTGAITAPADGKLLITASGNFQKSDDTTTVSDAFCTIEMSTNGGPFSAIGQDMGINFFHPFQNGELSATAGAAVSRGSTYDVALNCESFNTPTVFVRGDMITTFVG